ncbi:MAG: DUF4339 domain-containing protein, partial [Planctomycetales bacterium]|nr:DUF4339 domain-containing protein [Planctomycetales bacterium]
MAQWFCAIGDRQLGPLSGQTLRQMAHDGALGKQDLVRQGDDGNWVQAWQVKGLFPAATTANGSSSDIHTKAPTAGSGSSSGTQSQLKRAKPLTAKPTPPRAAPPVAAPPVATPPVAAPPMNVQPVAAPPIGVTPVAASPATPQVPVGVPV